MRCHAIETKYRGYRFRSRLEARWAVFFDALGIEWEYELEGYQLGRNRYLPDFFLPTFDGGCFAEVKPHNVDWSEQRALCLHTGKKVWLCVGTPTSRTYEVMEKFGDEVGIWTGVPNADQAQGENRFFVAPGYENADGTIPGVYYAVLGKTFTYAVNAARAARFEYGEKGGRYGW